MKNSYKLRKPKSGFLFHSDAGSQYTSLKYKIELGKMHAIQSMSDVGKCYDNCRMESFFATLKKEKLYQLDTMKMTMEEVKTEVWRFVQYYN
ncbi:MAG: integrase core domain-containing protein, partial [Spirochaetia bacterium]|nr:integrase core domain-containing protein [Spirochaetia bacterium]